jgi:rfaE bifunctional protein kinase chain/domain
VTFHFSPSQLSGLRVLVVGDLVLDEYLIGRVSRLSREAPVPVLEQTRAEYVPGGAANPASNVQTLGSRAVMAGLLGEDEAASRLRKLLTGRGVDLAGVITDPDRPTTQKTRIVAEGAYVFAHHLARVDRLTRTPVSGDRERHLCDRIAAIIPDMDAVLVSDYRLGVVTPLVVETVLKNARAQHILTAVDTQGNLAAFSGFDLLRCNAGEAMSYLGRELADDAAYDAALRELTASLQARSAIITRGPEGLSGIDENGHTFHLPASNRTQVFDVTGAGDVLITVVTLALAAGLSLQKAAELGNRAAGVAVTRLGNVAVRPEDLA